jgi:hypothetical protein
MAWLRTAAGRKAIYGVAIAAIALITAYGIVDPERAPLWIALVAALLGLAAPITALRNITPDGFDAKNIPDDIDNDVVLEIEN